MHETNEPTVAREKAPTGIGHNDPFVRLADAVNALTEVNYSGGEFESLIDELGAAYSDYRSPQG